MATSYYRPMISQQTFVPPTQENQSQQETSKKKSKRSRNPDNWKKEKRKRAILSGQAYLNTKGELVGPRSIGPDCNCKHKCFLNVTDENRLAIFKGYYSLKSYDEQNAYLYGLIRRYDIQRKRKPVSERRTCSYKYYVRVKGREIQVCKKAFANIHGISDKKIRTLCIKHEQNILFPRDNRGRHNNRPKKVTPELVNLIKHHILRMLSGPTVGDFIKTDKNQGPDVNISKLHKSFLQEYQPEAIDKESGTVRTENLIQLRERIDKVLKDFDAKVKSWLYFKIFHEEFNSMDFHTVKRKLADLRKSLEMNGSLQARRGGRKVGRSKSGKSAGNSDKEKGPHAIQSPSSQHLAPTLAIPHGSVNPLMTTGQVPQMGYVGVGGGSQQVQQQPTPAFPHNLQLSMLSLQHLNGNHPCSPNPFSNPGAQHLSQQPLNLQTGTANIPGVDQSGTTNQTTAAQPFSLNLHSVGGPMSSYYLCFGHVSNLIPLPVSSNSAVTGGHQLSNGQSSNPTFPAQHNAHQFTSTLLQPHSSASVPISQTGMVNTPHPEANIISSYHSSHQTHMY